MEKTTELKNLELRLKELYEKLEKLNQAAALATAGPLSALHEQAKLIRSTVLSLDKSLRHELPDILTKLDGVKPYTDSKQYVELETLGNDPEAKLALAELTRVAMARVEKLEEAIHKVAKSIHDDRNSLSDSTLKERIDTAYADKAKEVDDHILLINNTITPLLNSISEELAAVDKGLKESLKANPFKKAVELLPPTNAINNLDPKQPELSAAKLGYELVLSTLKGMAEIHTIVTFVDEHNSLLEKKKELQKQYDKHYAVFMQLKKELDEIVNLNMVDIIAHYYDDVTKVVEEKLIESLKAIQQTKKSPRECGQSIGALKLYIRSLKLTWR